MNKETVEIIERTKIIAIKREENQKVGIETYMYKKNKGTIKKQWKEKKESKQRKTTVQKC